jgi:hypothetical protein
MGEIFVPVQKKKKTFLPPLAEAGLIGDSPDGNRISTSILRTLPQNAFKRSVTKLEFHGTFRKRCHWTAYTDEAHKPLQGRFGVHRHAVQRFPCQKGPSTGRFGGDGHGVQRCQCQKGLAKKKRVSWWVYSVSTAQKNNYLERSWGLAEGKIILDTRGPPFYRSCNRWTAFIHLKVVE